MPPFLATARCIETDKKLARIVKIAKGEAHAHGLNQHTLEKISGRAGLQIAQKNCGNPNQPQRQKAFRLNHHDRLSFIVWVQPPMDPCYLEALFAFRDRFRRTVLDRSLK